MKAFKVRIAILYVFLCIIGFVNAEELHHKANINPSETFSNVEVYNNKGKQLINAHVLSEVVQSPETVTTEVATKSVEDAIQAAEKSVQEIEKIIREISDAKRNEEIIINKEKNRANDANKKALEKGKEHEKAVKDFLGEVKSASDEADKKAVSALQKLTKAETDAQNAKKEAELAKTEATNAKNDNADSETNNNFSKKKEKGDNAKTKAESAKTKADEAKKILTEVQTEIKALKEHSDKSDIALQKVLVGLFNEEMKPYLELSNKYADEANKKKTEAANQKAEMNALQTQYNDIPKETVQENIQKTIRAIDEVTKCAEKVLQTHSYIQYYEKEVEKGLEEIKKITDAANASTKKGSVEINVISLIQQEKYAKNDSSKLTSGFEKMEKTKYEVIARMAAKRADLALSQTNTHMTNAAEKKKQASDALQSIIEMHQKLTKETSMGVLPKQKAAEDALRRINEETEKIGVSLQEVKQHKKEVDDALSFLSTEGVTVTAMGEKATMAENAATNAKTEALNAHNTHSILLEHIKKFENALSDCKVILAPLNSNEAVKKAQTHVTQMNEKERKVNGILLEIEKLQKNYSK